MPLPVNTKTLPPTQTTTQFAAVRNLLSSITEHIEPIAIWWDLFKFYQPQNKFGWFIGPVGWKSIQMAAKCTHSITHPLHWMNRGKDNVLFSVEVNKICHKTGRLYKGWGKHRSCIHTNDTHTQLILWATVARVIAVYKYTVKAKGGGMLTIFMVISDMRAIHLVVFVSQPRQKHCSLSSSWLPLPP